MQPKMLYQALFHLSIKQLGSLETNLCEISGVLVAFEQFSLVTPANSLESYISF